jgi:hypothetical protein
MELVIHIYKYIYIHVRLKNIKIKKTDGIMLSARKIIILENLVFSVDKKVLPSP